jgi:hypothetical protein
MESVKALCSAACSPMNRERALHHCMILVDQLSDFRCLLLEYKSGDKRPHYAEVVTSLREISNNSLLRGSYLDGFPDLSNQINQLYKSISTRLEWFSDQSEDSGPQNTLPDDHYYMILDHDGVWLDAARKIRSDINSHSPRSIRLHVELPNGEETVVRARTTDRVGDIFGPILPDQAPPVGHNYAYTIGNRPFGKGGLNKQIGEFVVGPEVRAKVTLSEDTQIRKARFSLPLEIDGTASGGREPLWLEETFIIGKITSARGWPLGIRELRKSMTATELMDRIMETAASEADPAEVDREFKVKEDGNNSVIFPNCPIEISRVHAVIYQEEDDFYYLDTSKYGSRLEGQYIKCGRYIYRETGCTDARILLDRARIELFGKSFEVGIGRGPWNPNVTP